MILVSFFSEDNVLSDEIKIYPLKKVTQHDFDRYFFYPGFVFIKLDIPGKPVHLPFD